MNKQLDIETGAKRLLAIPTSIRAIDDNARTITFAASTETEDRYGDIIRVKGWDLDNYNRNPVFLWAHDASQPPIGKILRITKESTALVAVVQFADAATYEFADTVFKLYRGGFLNAVSVGFIPKQWGPRLEESEESGGVDFLGYEFTEQELLELSAVPVPANPDALSLAAGCNSDPQLAAIVELALAQRDEKSAGLWWWGAE